MPFKSKPFENCKPFKSSKPHNSTGPHNRTSPAPAPRNPSQLVALAVGAALTGLAASGCTAPGLGATQPAGGSAPAGAPQAPASGPAHETAPSAARPVSEQQALRTATDTYGGQPARHGADHENGRPTWRTDLLGSREGDLEVEVAQDSGAILAVDHEDRDDHDHDDDGD